MLIVVVVAAAAAIVGCVVCAGAVVGGCRLIGHWWLAGWLAGWVRGCRARSIAGSTLLHHAVGSNNLTCVKFLISMKADPLARNESGVDPLNVAIMRGHDAVSTSFRVRVRVRVCASGQCDGLAGEKPIHMF